MQETYVCALLMRMHVSSGMMMCIVSFDTHVESYACQQAVFEGDGYSALLLYWKNVRFASRQMYVYVDKGDRR